MFSVDKISQIILSQIILCPYLLNNTDLTHYSFEFNIHWTEFHYPEEKHLTIFFLSIITVCIN